MKTKLLLAFLMFMFLGCTSKKITPSMESHAMRGVWLTNVDSDVLFSRKSIEEAVKYLSDHGFNTIYVVMWNDAHTLFPSKVSQKYLGYTIDPRLEGRDPLQEIIEAGNERNLRIIPWFEYGFAASYKKDGGVILDKYPHWAARDTSGALLTKNGFEWLNAYHPEVQSFLSEIILEVVANYDIDGIQGDDRLPAHPVEGGYSEFTRQLYADAHNGSQPPSNPRDPDFKRWRADILNAFGKNLYHSVKAIKPDIAVSWAPSIYPWSYDEYLQDWPSWIRDGYADEIIPQNYRYSFKRYESTLLALSKDSLKINESEQKLITPGVLMNVGDYLIPEDYLMDIIELHRQQGYQGEVFFFYEGLRKQNDKLGDLIAKEYAAP